MTRSSSALIYLPGSVQVPLVRINSMSLDAYKILDGSTPFDEALAHSAALSVVSLARDKDDARLLLDTLGLTEFEQERKNRNLEMR